MMQQVHDLLSDVFNTREKLATGLCPNCRMRKGYMSCSKWVHDFNVCSDNCGDRLDHRIKSGMMSIDEAARRTGGGCMVPYDPKGERIVDLRNEIRWLRYLLKARKP